MNSLEFCLPQADQTQLPQPLLLPPVLHPTQPSSQLAIGLAPVCLCLYCTGDTKTECSTPGGILQLPNKETINSLYLLAEFLLILPRICLIFFTIGTDTLLTYCPTDFFLKTCVIAIGPPSVLLPRISLSQMQDLHLCWTSGDSCQPISPAYVSVSQHTYCFSQFDIVPNHTLTKNKLCPIIQVISNEWCLLANQSLVVLGVSESDDPAGFLPNLPSTLPVHTSRLCLEHGKWWEERTKSLGTERREDTAPARACTMAEGEQTLLF